MIEQSIVHLPELVKDIERPVSIYLVHLSSEVTAQWPVFAKEIDALRAKNIDAKTSDPAWDERHTL